MHACDGATVPAHRYTGKDPDLERESGMASPSSCSVSYGTSTYDGVRVDASCQPEKNKYKGCSGAVQGRRAHGSLLAWSVHMQIRLVLLPLYCASRRVARLQATRAVNLQTSLRCTHATTNLLQYVLLSPVRNSPHGRPYQERTNKKMPNFQTDKSN
jgi:hypothetical protein